MGWSQRGVFFGAGCFFVSVHLLLKGLYACIHEGMVRRVYASMGISLALVSFLATPIHSSQSAVVPLCVLFLCVPSRRCRC